MKFKSFRPKFGQKKENVIPEPARLNPEPVSAPTFSGNNRPPEQKREFRAEPQQARYTPEVSQQNPKNTLRLTPLGGVGLVQKNMFVYEYGDDIVIIDCGVGFPDDGMPGVDLIIPDIGYLKDKKHKIKAIIITHAHDDHIGGLPYIWPELQVPIYSQKLTIGFIKTKFLDHKLPTHALKALKIDDKLKLGNFEVSFYQVSHSVPDSTGIVLKTPVGTLVHQSDFKVDWTPVNGQKTDVATAATVSQQGVQFMTIDCLGVEKAGYTPSEKNIEPTFEAIEQKTKGKLIITLMTSNITRIQQALNVAFKAGRKVSLLGRSMENNFQVSRDLGYLDIPPGLIINQEQIKSVPDNQLLLIMAGSLGQPGSALSRAANGDHKYVQIKRSDTVVFSADPMPSAVVNQNAIINSLTKIGCDVIASTLTPELHVSGHASVEEIKLMINIVRPKYLMPVGGEFKHMRAFAKMAQELGYREDQIMLPDEGQMVNITPQKVFINGQFKTQNIYVDGLGVGDIGTGVLKDRQVMAEEGVVVVVVPLDHQTGRVAGEPDLMSRGLVMMGEGEQDLLGAAKQIVKSVLAGNKGEGMDWRYTRHEIENHLKRFFFEETKRSPMILATVVEV